MADVTLNDAAVLRADLILPLRGCWSAHIHGLDGAKVPSGPVTLRWLGTDLHGTIYQAGESEGQLSALVIGGAGRLARSLPARGYQQSTPASLVVQHILQEAGETPAPLVGAGGLDGWSRAAGEAAQQLDVLADVTGDTWRVQLDGRVWWGKETWPAADTPPLPLADAGYDLAQEEPELGLQVITPRRLVAVPGQTLRGQRIGHAVYRVTGEGGPEAFLWTLREGDQEGQLAEGLRRLIRQELRAVDYLARYPAQVLAYRADTGQVDVAPDSKRVPPLCCVPLRVPAPGAKVVAPPGSRVLLGFRNGDPRYPYCDAFEQGTATRGVAAQQDAVAVGTITFAAVANGVLTGTYVPPTGAPVPFVLGQTITLQGRITSGSDRLFLP